MTEELRNETNFRNFVGTRIFSVDYVKKDGTSRKVVARLEVKKGVKGIGQSYNPRDYGQITVFDMQKQQFRNLVLANMSNLRCGN